MIQTYNVGTIYWQPWEWILVPGLVILVYFLGARYKTKKIGQNPEYKYFLTGLMLKVIAGIFFAAIYVFYYNGGDTINYYASSVPLANLFWYNPSDYFTVLFDSEDLFTVSVIEKWDANTYNLFTSDTGYPMWFMSNDPHTFMVCKITSPFLIIFGNSYFAATIVLSALTYIPIWMTYKLFLKYFPSLSKELAIAIVLMPSVMFWGSGIMKDTFTLTGLLLAFYYFEKILFSKEILLIKFYYLFIFLLSSYLILSIKPYILNIFIPSLGLWVVSSYSKRIHNPIFRFIIVPSTILIGLGGSIFILQSLGSSMDKFALDKAISTAQITQEDLKREEQYGSNNFDIGELDGSIPNLLSKFPLATTAGLFRPYIFEARSPVVLLSGLENTFLLLLTILALYKTKLSAIIQLIKSYPILLFSLGFSVLFAFMLGITTPNFGALVRFKIPLIPFFTAMIMIFYSANKFLVIENVKEKNNY